MLIVTRKKILIAKRLIGNVFQKNYYYQIR